LSWENYLRIFKLQIEALNEINFLEGAGGVGEKDFQVSVSCYSLPEGQARTLEAKTMFKPRPYDVVSDVLCIKQTTD